VAGQLDHDMACGVGTLARMSYQGAYAPRDSCRYDPDAIDPTDAMPHRNLLIEK